MSQPLNIGKSHLLTYVVSALRMMTKIFLVSNLKILKANVKLKVNKPQKRMGVMEQLIKTKNSKIFHFVTVIISLCDLI